jgi:hypothetical protein
MPNNNPTEINQYTKGGQLSSGKGNPKGGKAKTLKSQFGDSSVSPSSTKSGKTSKSKNKKIIATKRFVVGGSGVGNAKSSTAFKDKFK